VSQNFIEERRARKKKEKVFGKKLEYEKKKYCV
jgi:hypothetical protein